MILLFLGCIDQPEGQGDGDPADTGALDTGSTDTAGPVDREWALIAGAPADGLGNAVTNAGDMDADGAPDV